MLPWNKLKENGNIRLALVAAMAGIVIGAAARLLKWLVGLITGWVGVFFNPSGNNLWLIFLPMVGILIVGFLVRNVIKTPMGNSTSVVRRDVAANNDNISWRLMFAPIVTCALTLGFGGSGGAESPIAYSGGAIAGNVARVMRVRKEDAAMFIALGAGAGIAAIFQSPLGGFFYIFEVIGMRMNVRQTLMAGAMCLAAYLSAYAINGFNLLLPLNSSIAYKWEMLPTLLLLGLIVGLYAAYYQLSGLYVKRRIESFRHPVARNVVSGLIMGGMLCLFPALYGEGYGVLQNVVYGGFSGVDHIGVLHLFHGRNLLLWSLAGILLLKGMAVYASNSGGGVVGTFTPTFFAGGLLGALVLFLVPTLPVPEDVMVLCGMGAAMAAIKQAPLVSIFVVVELTGMSQLFLPVTATVIVAFLTARFLLHRLKAV